MRPVADAANISPYSVTHPAPATHGVEDTHPRKVVKYEKSRADETRFRVRVSHGNTPPRQLDLNDEIPNYPPPSFQEAISTPALSLCPSTATLNPEPPSASSAESDDDESLEIVQMDTVPQLPDTEDRGRPKYRESEGKKRHLSLSPLRTLLPFSSRERKISSHSNSPYFRSTPFLRSTASLKTGPNLNPSILRLPLSSPTTPTRHDFMSIFRKDKSHSDDDDPLESWELLPVNLLTAAEAVTNPSSNSSSLTSSPTRPAFEEEPLIRPREKKLGIFPRRNNRHVPPQPLLSHEETIGQPTANLPTVFTSPLSTERPWNAESVSSPVREDTFERALQTPLPQTPIEPPVRPRELSPIITSSLVPCQHVSPLNRDVTSSPLLNSPAQNRHHYRGRPLPRTPSSNRPIVDSTYGSVESSNMSTTRVCPEGLLIDFDGPIVRVRFDNSTYKPSNNIVSDEPRRYQ